MCCPIPNWRLFARALKNGLRVGRYRGSCVDGLRRIDRRIGLIYRKKLRANQKHYDRDAEPLEWFHFVSILQDFSCE